MKTAEEIIDEVANFYNLGSRSIGNGGCLYNGPDGKQCAFARMCVDPTLLSEGISAMSLLFRNGEDILKEEYRGHRTEFYYDVQRLHDEEDNWTLTGLSEKRDLLCFTT